MIVRKATIYTLGEFSNRIGKSLAVFLLAYLVAKEQYGIYSYLVAASGVVAALLDSGLNTLVILRASVQRFRRLFKLIVICKLAVLGTVVCALLGWNFIAPLFRNLAASAFVPFVAISLALDLQAFVGNSLRARLDYNGDAIVKMVGSLGFLAVLAGMYLLGWQLNAIAALWSQAAILTVAVVIGAMRIWVVRAQFARLGPHVERGFKSLLAISVPFAASSFCGSFFNTIDTLMLGMLSAFSANATFSLIHRVGLMSHVPVGILVGFILPYLTARFGKGRAAPPDREFMDWLISICAIAGLGVSQLYVLGVDWVVVPTLGAAYRDAMHVASVLSLYVVPIYCYSVINTTLIAKRFIVSTSLLFGVATLLSAALDYIVVSTLNPLMVAYVCTSVNWLLLGGFCFLYRTRLGVWPMSASTVALIIVAGSTVVALSFVPSGNVGAAIRLISCCVAAVLAASAYFRKMHLLRPFVLHQDV